MIARIVQVAHHRNGSGGAPFYAVLFERSADRRRMVATVFEERGAVAVLEVDPLLGPAGVTFGENSHRGDVYETELRQAIVRYEAARRAEE